MKERKTDLLSILKYVAVAALILYIAVLVMQEGTKDVPVKTIKESIMKATTEDGMKKGTTQDLKRYYGLNANDYDGVMLYIPDDVMSVNEILVIKLKNKAQAEAVEEAANARLEQQRSSFEGYGAVQTRLINSAVLDSRGHYVFLVISENADQIYEAYKKCI